MASLWSWPWVIWSIYCFFFQAEDGIRDLTVTGVQTCALPILVLVILKHRLYLFDAGARDENSSQPVLDKAAGDVDRLAVVTRGIRLDQRFTRPDRKSVV